MSATANDLDAVTPAPASAEAKGPRKLNAVKSGIYAKTIVLHKENQAAYDCLGADLTEFWQPINAVERLAVRNIQNASWRHTRAIAIDFALYALGAEEQLESIRQQFPDKSESAQFVLAETAAYRANLRTINQLSHQEGRLLRALERANLEMTNLVANRQPSEVPPPPQADTKPAPAKTSPTAPPAPAGFVSTKYPANMPTFVGKKAKQHRRLWLNKHGLTNLAETAPLA